MAKKTNQPVTITKPGVKAGNKYEATLTKLENGRIHITSTRGADREIRSKKDLLLYCDHHGISLTSDDLETLFHGK